MSENPKIYGVIAEWKEEGPLVMEGALLTLDQAHTRMREMSARPTVVRVAMFRAVYESGNNALIPQESQP